MAILPDSTEEFDQGETHILASSLFNSNGLFLSPEEHRSFDSVLQELLSHQNQGINSMRQELASLRDAVDRSTATIGSAQVTGTLSAVPLICRPLSSAVNTSFDQTVVNVPIPRYECESETLLVETLLKAITKQKDTELKKLYHSLEMEKENSESLHGKCLALEESLAQLEATVDMQSESTELARTQLNHLQAELLRVKKELMEAYVAMAKKDDLLETLQSQLGSFNHYKDNIASQLKQEDESLKAELRDRKKQLADTEAQLKKLCDAMKENCKEPIAKKEQSVTPVRLSLSVEDFLDSLLEDGDFQSHTQSVGSAIVNKVPPLIVTLKGETVSLPKRLGIRSAKRSAEEAHVLPTEPKSKKR